MKVRLNGKTIRLASCSVTGVFYVTGCAGSSRKFLWADHPRHDDGGGDAADSPTVQKFTSQHCVDCVARAEAYPEAQPKNKPSNSKRLLGDVNVLNMAAGLRYWLPVFAHSC